MIPRQWLVLFVKEPRMGRVKTRLARGLGTVRATVLYRRMTGRIIRQLSSDPRWTTVLAVAPDGADVPEWSPAPCRLNQGPGNLGTRMESVFQALPPGPAVIVGSDVPDVNSRYVSCAFSALGKADVVFGPSEDGGYWLIGLARRRPLKGLFDQVRWSGPDALADTRANVPGRLRVAEIATLPDIDTAEDLERWRARAALSRPSSSGVLRSGA